MKTIFVVATAFLLTACASGAHVVNSDDPSILVVDLAPAGYPITTDIRIGNTCTKVKESWAPFKDPASGKQLWLKQVDRIDMPCQ